MGILLEIRGGPFAGRRVPVRTGEILLIGRAPDRAQFAIPHDNHMSGLHFAVECAADGCRVLDKKSTNGTLLNGGKIQEAMLATGDEIKSGQTVFVVRIVPDDKLPATQPPGSEGAAPPQQDSAVPSASSRSRPAAASHAGPSVSSPPPVPPERSAPPPPKAPPITPSLSARPAASSSAGAPSSASRSPAVPAPSEGKAVLSIGAWRFGAIPKGWQIQGGLGIQQDATDKFPSSIVAMQEQLGPNITLQQYVEAQIKMFREYLREPRIDAALPPKISGAVETMAIEVRYSTKEGQSVYYQRVYARQSNVVGVLTLTALEKDAASVRPDYQTLLDGVTLGS